MISNKHGKLLHYQYPHMDYDLVIYYMFLNLKLDDSLDFHLFLWYLVCYLKKGTTK